VLQEVRTIPISDIHGSLHTLKICVGDATDLTGLQPPDVIAISCFPNDYYPRAGTVVGCLSARGINVDELSKVKERDWRLNWQTWISKPINHFGKALRVACFEHAGSAVASEVVGNVFRSASELALETSQSGFNVLRVPLLSTGDQGESKALMLEAILEQAYQHLRGGVPIESIQLVLYDKDPSLYELLFQVGKILEGISREWIQSEAAVTDSYDCFISYRRIDLPYVMKLTEAIKGSKPLVKIYRDQHDLTTGGYWKQELIQALQRSRHAICVITDSYIDSVECIDEFHIALCRMRQKNSYLIPLINLNQRDMNTLPRSMRRVNMIPASCPPQNFNEIVSLVSSKI